VVQPGGSGGTFGLPRAAVGPPATVGPDGGGVVGPSGAVTEREPWGGGGAVSGVGMGAALQ
jgi:hypothetical protein